MTIKSLGDLPQIAELNNQNPPTITMKEETMKEETVKEEPFAELARDLAALDSQRRRPLATWLAPIRDAIRKRGRAVAVAAAGLYALVFAFNYARTPMPTVAPSYSATEFMDNGFVGGTALRVSYLFRERKMMSISSLTGYRSYYYKIGDNLFKYDQVTQTWYQIQ